MSDAALAGKVEFSQSLRTEVCGGKLEWGPWIICLALVVMEAMEETFYFL